MHVDHMRETQTTIESVDGRKQLLVNAQVEESCKDHHEWPYLTQKQSRAQMIVPNYISL